MGKPLGGPLGNDTVSLSSGVTGVLPVANGGTGASTFPKPVESFDFVVSDETTDLTTGTAKLTFRMPYAFTITGVRASVNTAPVGSAIIVNIKESNTTIFSTKISIDAGQETSTTSATPAVLSDTALADDAEITIDIDQIGSGTPGKGLKVSIIGTRT